jgi:GNAT superfamily N-acetyltransferase
MKKSHTVHQNSPYPPAIDGFQIHQAVKKDAAEIAHVQVDSYLSAYKDLLPEEYLANFTYGEQEKDWSVWQSDHPEDILLVAEDEGVVIGYALSRELRDEPGWGEVAALHVSPSLKRRGVGKALFAESARKLQDRGCCSLLIWTLEGNPSRGFYEHLGGKLNGTKHWVIEELDFDQIEVCYRWEDITCVGG